MSLNQVIWYSLALGALVFTIIFIVSLIVSRYNRRPAPYADNDSLTHPSRKMRGNVSHANRKVMRVNNHYQMRDQSIDIVNNGVKFQRSQSYKRYAEVGKQNSPTKAVARYTVVNEVNNKERFEPQVFSYSRGLGRTTANFL